MQKVYLRNQARDFGIVLASKALGSVIIGIRSAQSKSPKDLFGAGFANLKIARPADRYRASVAETLPKSLRTLYRGGRTWASNSFISDDVVIYAIERHGYEIGNFGHKSALPRS
jgi:hypothetical protein